MTGREYVTLIKTVGCILIIVSGCFFSRRIIGNDDASIQRLTSLMELLKAIKSRIENYCMPTDEILSELPAELFERCGYDPAFLPHTVDELISGCENLGDAEIQYLLERFFYSLGTAYKSEEVVRCKLACEDLEAIIAGRRAENVRRRKTVPVLGFCISLVIVIIAF